MYLHSERILLIQFFWKTFVFLGVCLSWATVILSPTYDYYWMWWLCLFCFLVKCLNCFSLDGVVPNKSRFYNFSFKYTNNYVSDKQSFLVNQEHHIHLRDFISVFELSSSADWFNNSGARVVIATVIPLNANMIQWTEPEQWPLKQARMKQHSVACCTWLILSLSVSSSSLWALPFKLANEVKGLKAWMSW